MKVITKKWMTQKMRQLLTIRSWWQLTSTGTETCLLLENPTLLPLWTEYNIHHEDLYVLGSLGCPRALSPFERISGCLSSIQQKPSTRCCGFHTTGSLWISERRQKGSREKSCRWFWRSRYSKALGRLDCQQQSSHAVSGNAFQEFIGSMHFANGISKQLFA